MAEVTQQRKLQPDRHVSPYISRALTDRQKPKHGSGGHNKLLEKRTARETVAS
jgi:hypothetical protein